MDGIAALEAAVEILVLFLIFHTVILSFRNAPGERVIRGYAWLFLLISMPLFLLSRHGNLPQMRYLLSHFLGAPLLLAVVVIFQRELRTGLLQAGEIIFGPARSDQAHHTLEYEEELFAGLEFLARRKVGALIAIERDVSLVSYLAQGIELDAKLSKELMWAIFWHESLLHDGGIILRKNRVSAASCIFPLTEKNLPPYLGTRHRAAVGLSEVTDALVLVVSEERGEISLCFKGHLYRNICTEDIKHKLDEIHEQWLKTLPPKECPREDDKTH